MHLPSGDGKVVLCMDRVNVLKGLTGKVIWGSDQESLTSLMTFSHFTENGPSIEL